MMNNKPIYLDYMATTPVDPRVVDVMMRYLSTDGEFGNPASVTHAYGWNASTAVEKARAQVAALVHAEPKEIIWTSGATESDNLAIIGAARFYHRKGRHIITCKTEHKAVLDACKYLEGQGFEVTYLTPQSNGLIDLTDLEKAIRPDTILVSLMHVNNEIGVIQDIKAMGEITRRHGIVFHVDAAQSAGKIPIDLQELQVDLMSFSAHKLYGPKGMGALYVRRKPRVRLEPLIHGGGHETGLRSGTLATHQIVGMGEAFAIANQQFESDKKHIQQCRDKLWQGLCDIPGITINGDVNTRYQGNLNLTIEGIEGDSLILAFQKLALSTASACTSASIEPSYVLRALGISQHLAHSTIRLSVGRFTTLEEIDLAVAIMQKEIKRLRAIAP